MTQVVYGQKGYLGSSMSVRAAEAYEQGEMPISRWTKTAIIQAVKDYCFDFDLAYDPDIENNTKAELVKEFLEYKSWHHSSRTARKLYEHVRGNEENKTLLMAYLIISLLTIAQLVTIIFFLNNLVQIFV